MGLINLNPAKAIIDGIKSKVESIDANHNGKPDVQEIKADLVALEGKLKTAEQIPQLIAEIQKDSPEVLAELEALLPKTFANPKVKLIIAGVQEAIALAPEAIALEQKVAGVVHSLGG